MDVKIEAAPMAAEARVAAVVIEITPVALPRVTVALSAVASSSCPSISGHSISAVAPDHNFILGGLPKAA